MILGNCPYCDDGKIEVRDKVVMGKKVKLYACTNANWMTMDEGEVWQLTEDSTCEFKIWQNSLARYGKWLNYKEIKELLSEEQVEVELTSKQYGKPIKYTKFVVLDQEYGVSVVWD